MIQKQQPAKSKTGPQYVVKVTDKGTEYGPKSKAHRYTFQAAQAGCMWHNENRAAHHQVIEESEAR